MRGAGEQARNTQLAANKMNVCRVLATFSDILKETDEMSLKVVKSRRKKKGNTKLVKEKTLWQLTVI